MDVEFKFNLSVPDHDNDLIENGYLEERLRFVLTNLVPLSYKPVLTRTSPKE